MAPKKKKKEKANVTMADISSFFPPIPPKQKVSSAWTTNAPSASAPSASDNHPPPEFLRDDCFSNFFQEESFVSEVHCNHRRSILTNGAKSEQGDSRKRKAEEDEGKKPPAAVQDEEKEEEEIIELGVKSEVMLVQERLNRAEQSGKVISLLDDEDADAPNALSLQDLKPNLTPLIEGNARNANIRLLESFTFVALEVTPRLEEVWYTHPRCALIRQEELYYVETKYKTDQYRVGGSAQVFYGRWTEKETNQLRLGVAKYGSRWWILVAANFVKTRNTKQCSDKYEILCPREKAEEVLPRKSALSRESRMSYDYRGMVFAFGHPYNPTRLATEYSPDKFPLRLNDPGVHDILVEHKILTKNCEICDEPFTETEKNENVMCVEHWHCEVTKRAVRSQNPDATVKAGVYRMLVCKTCNLGLGYIEARLKKEKTYEQAVDMVPAADNSFEVQGTSKARKTGGVMKIVNGSHSSRANAVFLWDDNRVQVLLQYVIANCESANTPKPGQIDWSSWETDGVKGCKKATAIGKIVTLKSQYKRMTTTTEAAVPEGTGITNRTVAVGESRVSGSTVGTVDDPVNTESDGSCKRCTRIAKGIKYKGPHASWCIKSAAYKKRQLGNEGDDRKTSTKQFFQSLLATLCKQLDNN